jgi:hypothetical protein
VQPQLARLDEALLRAWLEGTVDPEIAGVTGSGSAGPGLDGGVEERRGGVGAGHRES